jgi:hypothetical protein
MMSFLFVDLIPFTLHNLALDEVTFAIANGIFFL